MHCDNIFCRPFLYKNVVVESIISVKECHKAHHFGTMRHMIRSVTPCSAAAHIREALAAANGPIILEK